MRRTRPPATPRRRDTAAPHLLHVAVALNGLLPHLQVQELGGGGAEHTHSRVAPGQVSPQLPPGRERQAAQESESVLDGGGVFDDLLFRGRKKGRDNGHRMIGRDGGVCEGAGVHPTRTRYVRTCSHRRVTSGGGGRAWGCTQLLGYIRKEFHMDNVRNKRRKLLKAGVSEIMTCASAFGTRDMRTSEGG